MSEGMKPIEDEPISLVDDSETAAGAGGLGIKPGLKTFGSKAGIDHKTDLKRPINADGTGATRCRVFYSKIAISSLLHMEGQINEWLENSKAEVKHVGHVIGTMEGKTQEANLIVMAWF